MLEETGYRVTKLQPLGTIYTSPGFTDEKIELFRAEVEPIRHASEEDLTLVAMPLARVMEAVDRGDITDLKSVGALLLARGYPRAR